MNFPGLETQCFYCRQLDFLPFNCKYCNEEFCLNHRTVESHDCEAFKAKMKWEHRPPPSPSPSSHTHSDTNYRKNNINKNKNYIGYENNSKNTNTNLMKTEASDKNQV